MTTWQENKSRIEKLWPVWADKNMKTPEMREYLDGRLGTITDQESVRMAILRHRDERNSIPEPKRIKELAEQFIKAQSDHDSIREMMSSTELEHARRNRLQVLLNLREINVDLFHGVREFARASQSVEMNCDSRSEDPAEWPDAMTFVACRYMETIGEIQWTTYGKGDE